MANIRNKIYNWLKSAAGMIACGLFFGTMALLYLFKFYYGEFSEADCKNLWIGLAVNFFASIFTVSLVQMVFEQEKKRSEQIEEKLLIERAHKIASRLIHRYILAFNCVVVPLDDRDNMSVEDLQSKLKMNFKFSDMRDLHLFTCLSGRKLFESSVSVFFREEQLLREYFESIRLKHNDDLWDILSEFIVASRANDVQEYILGNEKLCEGTKPLKDRIQKDIIAADVEDVRGSNNALLLPYVCLYDILKDEAESIKRYQQWMMDNNVEAT